MTRFVPAETKNHPGSFLGDLEMITKTFETEEDAAGYYWRFWGRHMHQPLPFHFLKDVTVSAPFVGKFEGDKMMKLVPLLANFGGEDTGEDR